MTTQGALSFREIGILRLLCLVLRLVLRGEDLRGGLDWVAGLRDELVRGVVLLEPSPEKRELGKLAKFANFLAGSFSAVSKRNFARKYAFDSIFQALLDLHPFAPLHSQNFRKKKIGLKKQQFW